MLRTAFSTVACPALTLDRVAQLAAEYGFMGVELRSFGYGGGPVASDPGLTDGGKTRRLFEDIGVRIACVASGARLDRPITPPVLGHLRGIDNAVLADTRQYIDIAAECSGGAARFFAFQRAPRECRAAAVRRISDRLMRVCDHARHRDVTVLIENGGSFPFAQDLQEFIERVGSPLLRASYDVATAQLAGECPIEGSRRLASRLALLRVRDLRDGLPCTLGTGEIHCREAAEALSRTGSRAWLVYSWDRLWLPDLAPAEQVLPEASKTLLHWAAADQSGSTAAA